MSGKGSGRRPGAGYEANHERLFGKHERQQYVPPPLPDESSHIAGPAAGGHDEEKDPCAT